MAIYHCRFKVHSRGGGAKAGQAAAYRSGTRVTSARTTSAVRAAAYRSGGILKDEAGEVHDFTRKEGVVWNGILAPDNVPAWAFDRNRLWNEVEKKEDRSTRPATAQLFREAELSIPRELNGTQRLALVRAFVQDQFVAKGMVADIGIHCPTASDGGEQPHAHVMLTMRDIGPAGFGNKRRDWNDITPRQKAAGEKSPLMQWREAWQTYCNAALEDAGSMSRVDHRSLAAQGKDHERQPHQGQAVHVQERTGGYARKRDDLMRVHFENRAREAVQAIRHSDTPRGSFTGPPPVSAEDDPFTRAARMAAWAVARHREGPEAMQQAGQLALAGARRVRLYARSDKPPGPAAFDPADLYGPGHER